MRSGRAIVLSDYIGGEGAASGGAGHAVLDSFRALHNAGADVRAIAGFGAAPQDLAACFTSLGGRDLRAGGAADMLRVIYNREAGERLAAVLADEDPATTLVILHQWTRYLSPAALGVIDRFPTMIYMHDYFWPCPNGAYYDFERGEPCRRTPMRARCLAADCDRQGRLAKLGRVARQGLREVRTRAPPARRLFLHLSPQSRATTEPLLPGERHAILHNPLAIGDASPAATAPRYQVGYFGRLEPEKGVAQLLAAIGGNGHSALFVGDGSLSGALADYAGIEHRAWQPRATMAAAMRSCGVVVLPSLWRETWGLIVPEAMAAGVPVLVSTRAGSSELVERFGGGATFDPAIAGDLAGKLKNLLADRPPVAGWHAGLRAFLSPQRHAGRILALAQTDFGLDLRATTAQLSAA